MFCAAEDWLNPSAILEAFEARAVRMAVNCAQNIAKASSPELGSFSIPLSCACLMRTGICTPKNQRYTDILLANAACIIIFIHVFKHLNYLLKVFMTMQFRY